MLLSSNNEHTLYTKPRLRLRTDEPGLAWQPRP